MKKTSKALLLSLCAVLLVTASVLGTMAYLTSADQVNNTFTVGNVKITLDETDVNVNGIKDSDTRVKANKYKLIPGHTYIKDPIVHVDANSEDCYLFVTIANDITQIEGPMTVADQMAAKGWVSVQGTSNVYVYTDKATPTPNPAIVTKGSNVPVFNNFTINSTVTGTELSNYSASKNILVTAYAIQADGFKDKTAAEIWEKARPLN